MPSRFLTFSKATSGVNTMSILCSVKGQTGVYALCLADRIHLPPFPFLTITLSQRLCSGIREHVTHVWTVASSNAVSPSDLAPRNTIIRLPARRGPFCSTERCPTRHKIDTEDVQAVMVDFERVSFIEPIKQSTIDRYRKRFVDIASSEYLSAWFRNICGYP